MARTLHADAIRLLAALLLLALAVALAGNQVHAAPADAARAAHASNISVPNLLDCPFETSRTHVHCHYRALTPSAPLPERVQDGDEMPAAIDAPTYPFRRPAALAAPRITDLFIAPEPTFIRFGNFRS